jgi:hypothetical protein
VAEWLLDAMTEYCAEEPVGVSVPAAQSPLPA